jgi:hypothetical protein
MCNHDKPTLVESNPNQPYQPKPPSTPKPDPYPTTQPHNQEPKPRPTPNHKKGFTDSAVEAAINTIEFSLRENNTGSFPRGLSLMLRAVGAWIYDRDPYVPIQVRIAAAAAWCFLS